jgi:hypothetical protein
MTGASERLHAAVVEKRLTHPDDPTSIGTSTAVARHTRRGWRIDKAKAATRSTPSSP